MTPKEKAIELVLKFKQRTHYVEVWHTPQLLDKFHNNGISCALILADYVIQGIYQIDHKHTAVYDNKGTFYTYKECQELKYWQEVKKEIESL